MYMSHPKTLVRVQPHIEPSKEGLSCFAEESPEGREFSGCSGITGKSVTGTSRGEERERLALISIPALKSGKWKVESGLGGVATAISGPKVPFFTFQEITS